MYLRQIKRPKGIYLAIQESIPAAALRSRQAGYLHGQDNG